MNEWLDLFGMESIWNDPDFPTNIQKQEQVEEYDRLKRIEEIKQKEKRKLEYEE